jgi:hypothetical protein
VSQFQLLAFISLSGHPMRYAETLLAEFDDEMKTTRTMLEQVPFGKDATKPGSKSRTMHELAAHIANIVRFGDLAIGADERDFSQPGAAVPASYDSAEELLKTFDANAAASRADIHGLDESRLGDTFHCAAARLSWPRFRVLPHCACCS